MKWQTGLISSVIGLGFILSVVLNLSGMSWSHDGDKFCTDCYSKIEVNSTYWNVCVEHAGDKTAIFKKTPTSRVLYINLDKINEVITTNPEIKTDLLVATTKSRAEFTSEYGYLRNAKDGDCIIERANKPNKFYIHGVKTETQQVKWSFNVESATIEDINIDPIWLAIDVNIEPIKECINSTIPETKHIHGNCTKERLNIYENNVTKINSTYVHYTNYSCVVGSYIYYWNNSDCRTIGYQSGGRKILFEEQGNSCRLNGAILECVDNREGSNGQCLGENSGKRCQYYDKNLNLISKSKDAKVMKIENS